MFVPAALAHVPHDTVRALAQADNGDWWLIPFYGKSTMISRSTDRGVTWNMVGGEPTKDIPEGIARLDDGRVVVLTDTHLWWSEDGATWTMGELPGDVAFIEGGATLRLAGAGGIWEGMPDALVQVLANPVARLGAGPSALATDGTAWTDAGGEWTAVGGTPTSTDIVGLVAGDVYAGDATGAVFRYAAGDWVPCGAIPPNPDQTQPYANIVAFAGDGNLLLTAAAWRTPFVSDDRCATWTDRSTGADVTFTATGGAGDPFAGWPILRVSGGRWAVAGWTGVYVSDDQGQSWTDAEVLGPDLTRSIAFGSDFRTSGKVWLGSYGAAVGFTEDGGATFDFSAHGMFDEDVQQVSQTSDPAEADHAYALVGWHAYVSADAGTTWTPGTAPSSEVRFFAPMSGLSDLWAFDVEGTQAQFWRSTDQAQTWQSIAALADAGGGGDGQGGVHFSVGGDAFNCVSIETPSRLVCSKDGDQTWSIMPGLATSESVSPPVLWPPEAPTRVIWTDDGSVHVSDPEAGSTTDVALGEVPGRVAVADDGTLILAARSAELYRSDDGGLHWSDLGVRLGSPVGPIRPRPDFAANPDVLIGTFDGSFRLDLRGTPTLQRWAAIQRIDDVSSFWPLYGNCPGPVANPAAAMDTVQAIPLGCSTTAWFRGTSMTVFGYGNGGAAELTIDGVLAATMSNDTNGVLAQVDGLSDGWHRIGIEGTALDGILFDAMQAIGPADPLPPAAGGDSAVDSAVDSSAPAHPRARCGCNAVASSIPGAPLLLMLALTRRRSGRSAGR